MTRVGPPTRVIVKGSKTINEGNELRLHFIYGYPQDKRERNWEKIYRDHIGVLNHRWRRDDAFRYRPETYKHYVNVLSTHIEQIEKFVKTFQLNEGNKLGRIHDLFDEAERKEGTDASAGEATERVVQSLHVLLNTIQPHTMLPGAR